MRPRITSALAAALCAAIAAPAALEGAARGALPRYPTVSATTIVFTAGGDLWSVPRDGGQARRLTDYPGLELFARFSPDGKWIAFFQQGDASFLQYGTEQGDGIFRLSLARFLSQNDHLSTKPEDIFMTAGISSVLDLLCTYFTQAGDTIFVEEPTLFPGAEGFCRPSLEYCLSSQR